MLVAHRFLLNIKAMNNLSIIILCGPTASGKSALGISLAHALNGEIINADSMQLYQEIPVITTQPSKEELAEIPHHLYGMLPASHINSAVNWLSHVKQEINACMQRQHIPIILGGTGMYIKALMEGLSDIPEIDKVIREEARSKDLEDVLNVLKKEDLESLETIKPNDAQRLYRAYEVWLQTGKPLSYWQNLPKKPLFPDTTFITLQIEIDRELLYQRINNRFDAMMDQDVIKEIEAFSALNLSTDLPSMRAVGVPELMAACRGEISLEEAIDKAKQASRNYAKRQLTWLRHQYAADIVIPFEEIENTDFLEDLAEKIRNLVDQTPANH